MDISGLPFQDEHRVRPDRTMPTLFTIYFTMASISCKDRTEFVSLPMMRQRELENARQAARFQHEIGHMDARVPGMSIQACRNVQGRVCGRSICYAMSSSWAGRTALSYLRPKRVVCMIDWDLVLSKLQEWGSDYGMKILAAALIFIGGRFLAKILRAVVMRLLVRCKTDQTLVLFVGHIVYIFLLVFVIIAAISKLGVHMTSFVAVVGAAGLAIGLALQGSLSNFAAGVLLIIFKPFKVGDFVEAAGVAGTIEEIQIFTTQLATPDNKTIIIPNGKLIGDNITNYSAKGTRRVDLVIGVGYGDDLKKVREVIGDVLAQDERILKEPAPTVAVCELAGSSVNFVVRPWVNVEDYWDVFFGIQEAMKTRFDAEGISIPFPQRDVHIVQDDSSA